MNVRVRNGGGASRRKRGTDEGMRGMVGIGPGPGPTLAPHAVTGGELLLERAASPGSCSPPSRPAREELSLARDDVAHPLIPLIRSRSSGCPDRVGFDPLSRTHGYGCSVALGGPAEPRFVLGAAHAA